MTVIEKWPETRFLGKTRFLSLCQIRQQPSHLRGDNQHYLVLVPAFEEQAVQPQAADGRLWLAVMPVIAFLKIVPVFSTDLIVGHYPTLCRHKT